MWHRSLVDSIGHSHGLSLTGSVRRSDVLFLESCRCVAAALCSLIRGKRTLARSNHRDFLLPYNHGSRDFVTLALTKCVKVLLILFWACFTERCVLLLLCHRVESFAQRGKSLRPTSSTAAAFRIKLALSATVHTFPSLLRRHTPLRKFSSVCLAFNA